MKTIYMGLNTEPIFELPKNIESFDESSKRYWRQRVERATKLREEIHQTMKEDGECRLSWDCEGRTRHQMHAQQWAHALPEYNFEIGYNYKCIVLNK